MDELPPETVATASEPPVAQQIQHAPKSSTGLDANIAAGLAALCPWLGAPIFLFIEKKSRFVRFYALQALVFFGLFGLVYIVLMLIYNVTQIHWLEFFTYQLATSILGPIYSIFWFLAMISAFSGNVYKVPLVGKWCLRQSGL